MQGSTLILDLTLSDPLVSTKIHHHTKSQIDTIKNKLNKNSESLGDED